MRVNVINLGLWDRVEKLIEAGGDPSAIAKKVIVMVQNYEKDIKEKNNGST